MTDDIIYDFIFFDALDALLSDCLYCDECSIGIIYQDATEPDRAYCDLCGQGYHIS